MNAVYVACTEHMDTERRDKFDAWLNDPLLGLRLKRRRAVEAVPDAPSLEALAAQQARIRAVQEMGGEVFG